MQGKRRYILLLAVAVFALTAVPTVVAAMPTELNEYMARLAAGSLYVPYYAVQAPSSGEATTVPDGYTPPVQPPSEPSSATPIPDGIAVQAMNLSRLEPHEEPQLLLMNETAYKAYPKVAADTVLNMEKGAVLIIHTHGTEAYLPNGATHYAPDEDFRTDKEEESVVAVGESFAAVLKSAGIEVYHDRTMYDKGDFQNAYTASRNAVKRHLAEKPQIRYIIDIHRDAVGDKDGNMCKTQCIIDGKESAQVMLVVGTNAAGAEHPNWRNNLCVAAKYQRALNSYPTFARPIYLRKSSFNQQLSVGSLLLEVGSAANTVEEAKRAAEHAAKCFVSLYYSI